MWVVNYSKVGTWRQFRSVNSFHKIDTISTDGIPRHLDCADCGEMASVKGKGEYAWIPYGEEERKCDIEEAKIAASNLAGAGDGFRAERMLGCGVVDRVQGGQQSSS